VKPARREDLKIQNTGGYTGRVTQRFKIQESPTARGEGDRFKALTRKSPTALIRGRIPAGGNGEGVKQLESVLENLLGMRVIGNLKKVPKEIDPRGF